MLLDIFNNSESVGNIVRSVSLRATEILWVFYVFLITIVIYAQYGS